MKDRRKTDRGRIIDLERKLRTIAVPQTGPSGSGTSGGGSSISLPIAESDVTNLVSDLAAKEATANKGAASGYASLNSSTKVVENPANATATPTASKIPIADASGKLAAGWGGSASTLATLNASTKVVEDPANATATAAASKIPIADGSGKLDTWISDAAAATKGIVKLAGDLGGTAALPTVVSVQAGVVTEAGITLADNTTNNVSTTKHGFAPKAPNDATKYLDGTGAYSVPTGTTYDELDILLGKKFFVDEGIIGSMTLFMRYAGTPTAFSGTGDGSWTARPGQYHCTSTGGLGYYDVGSAKGEFLLVLGGMYHATDFPMLGFSANQPTTRNPAALYVVNYNGGLAIQKSALAGNPATITNGTALNYDVGQAGVAFYYKQSTNMKKIFVRRNGGQWYHVLEESTDATFTTFRFVIFRMHSNVGRFQSPFGAWTS